MRFRSFATCLILALVCLMAAPALLADGTLLGTIGGRVVDQDGKALPGATVEVTSADKGFQRTAVSDSGGAFNFPLLQPGPYIVKITLAGFQSFESTNNVVQPEKTTAISATLKLATTAEAVTVMGEVPLVDKQNTTATTNVDSTLTQKLAVGRGYQNLISFAPGVSNNSGGNPNVHGSLSSTNLYLFDGVDSTDPTTGTFGQNFNYEAIQEVNVSTTGISAEYGRSQGAYVNVITKSGTNQFHGSFKLILTNDDWNSQNKGVSPITGASFARTKNDTTVKDYAYTLGGPFWQDHVWFFGAYENTSNTAAAAQTFQSPVYPNNTGQNYTQVTNVRLWDGKLSAQITPSQLFVGQFNSDPITGFIVDYWNYAPGIGSAELNALTAQGQNDCGGFGCTKQLHWSGVFGSAVSAEAGYSVAGGNITVAPFQGNGAPYFSLTDSLYYNGATFDGLVFRPRTQANVSASVYHELFGNAATFKGGVDYQIIKSLASFNYPTNNLFYITQYNPTVPAASQQFAVGDEWDQFTNPQPSTSRGKIWGFYGLEKFEAGRLSANLGVRVDHQTSTSDLAKTVIDATNWSPRLSAAYDVMGDGKTLVSAGYGRYYQFLVQNIADSVFTGVPQEYNKNVYLWDGSQFVFNKTVFAGGNAQPVNTGLDPSYTDEFNVAFQRQIGSTMAIGVRGIYRKWYNLVDDVKTLDNDGNLILTPFNFGSDVLKRNYKALEFTFEKRFSGNWQALVNYTLSRARGNQFSDFASQQLDWPGETCSPNLVGPIPCTVASSTNQYGIASYDRTSVANAFIAYTFNLPVVNITAAPSGTIFSGLPYQMQQTYVNPDNTRSTYFYTPRGSSRLPTAYQLNFALEATFKPVGNQGLWLIGGPLELGVKGEVFNLTNQQQQVSNSLISLLPNSNFGLPTSRNSFQTPRNYRFTGLIRF